MFDSIDGFDQLAEKFHELSGDITRTAQASHELELLIPIMLETLKTTHGLTLTMYQTFQAMINQMEAMSNTSIVMGQSFDKSQNDDFFYLPPEAFTNPEFIRGVKLFFSPDGKSVRFFITHQGDPMSPEGIARVARSAPLPRKDSSSPRCPTPRCISAAPPRRSGIWPTARSTT